MSLFPRFTVDGYYDDTGHWHRNKLCFMDCGARCTCKPPGGLWFDPRKVKSQQNQKPESE